MQYATAIMMRIAPGETMFKRFIQDQNRYPITRKKGAEGGIRTHESRGDTGLANLRLTRLGYLDFPFWLDLWLFNSSVSCLCAKKSC